MSKLFAVCKVHLTVLILACIFLAAPSAFADVPLSLTQQGRLLTADGQPMQGTKTLLFELYNDATEGAVVWSDQFEVDLGDSGFYTAILGSTDNPLDHTVLEGGPTFMQLVIDDKPLLPRLELTSVPYAQIAQMAKLADSVKPGAINTAAIADQAVTADKLDSIPWSKISDQPTIPTYTGADFVTSNQSCTTAGQMVIGISASGTLECADPVDKDTKYTAGSGLTLSGTSFSIASGGVTNTNITDMSWTKVTGKPEITNFASSDFVKSGSACTGSQFFMGFNANGTLRCGQPQDTTYTAQPNQGLSLTGNQFGVAQSGIKTGHIADDAITSAKIAPNNIQTAHITDSAITSPKVAPNTIQTAHIADGSISSDKLKDPLPLYAVTNQYCTGGVGTLSNQPSCLVNQDEPCLIMCSPPTHGSPSSTTPMVNCQGTCQCVRFAPACPNQKVGYLLSDPTP